MSGPYNAILGSAAVALPANEWPQVNPASVAHVERKHLSIFAQEGYGLPELRMGAFNFTLPTPTWTVGISAQSFGYSAYRESRGMASIARGFRFGSSRSIALGISTTLNQIRIQHVGSRQDASLSAGILAEPWPGLHLGISLLHWVQTNHALEEAFLLGASYLIPGTIRILTALHKTLTFPPSLHIGFEHYLHQKFILSTRLSSNPHRLALGVELKLATLTAHVLAEKHTVLNWTPGISIGVQL